MGFFQIFIIGLGLSMDSAAVSMTNGLAECKMSVKKTVIIAAVFGLFQGVMPLVGYLIGKSFAGFFIKIAPFAAFVLLGAIGIKMIVEAVKSTGQEIVCLRGKVLFSQAFATSIDALAVGLVFVGQSFKGAAVSFSIIALITFAVSLISLAIGKRCGAYLKNKAQIFGGLILITIGIKILAESLIGA